MSMQSGMAHHSGPMPVRSEVRRMVSEVKRSLASGDTASVAAGLQRLRPLLPSHGRMACDASEDFADLCAARECFREREYWAFLEALLGALSVELWAHLGREGSRLVEAFFLDGWPSEAVLVLGQQLTSARAFRAQRVLTLLEALVQRDALEEVVWEECCCPWPPSPLWAKTLALLATLPDRVAAQNEDSPLAFRREPYVRRLSQNLCGVLLRVHGRIVGGCDCGISAVSQVLGKLCLHGHADLMWEGLLPWLLARLNDPSGAGLWLRLTESLMSRVPDRCMESTVTALILRLPWFGHMSQFLGSAVLTHRQLRLLLTHKLLLLRFHYEPLLLQNILGYLANQDLLKPLFCETVISLMDVWSNASAVRHAPYEQLRYLSQAIVVALAFLKERSNLREQLKSELMQRLLSGMGVHLDSSVEQKRRLSMALGEMLTSTLDPEHRLCFEYEPNGDIDSLRQLMAVPELEAGSVDQKESSEEKRAAPEDDEPRGPDGNQDELDSDDDLEPFDVSNDSKALKVKAPHYLRECLEGLIVSDDVERVEICLRSIESLVRGRSPQVVQEAAVELAKVLLHLEKAFHMPDFAQCRFRGLVALTVTAPCQVAPYLTSQVYAANYHLRHRMDILEVLAAAAQELAQPAAGPAPDPAEPSPPAEPAHWRALVQQRIESKMRRFGRSQLQRALSENRLAPVAGLFFFPLMSQFDKPEASLDLLGQDHVLLSRLLYTLGSVMHAAIHTPVCARMALALAEFLWLFPYHPQSGVRLALIFCLCTMLLAAPSNVLFSDLQDQLLRLRLWLQDSVEEDPDADCRRLAAQALALMHDAFRREFPSDPSK